MGLRDDVAVLPGRPGHDLIVSKDAMTEGVHFLSGEAPEVIAQRLLRTSLSDLAAKAAEPFGYFLMTAWPPDRGEAYRRAFTRGLAEDGERFGLVLLGGDTISIPGPLTLSATVLGWAPHGAAVLRSGAKPGDRLMVCGQIGDGSLGLRAAQGLIPDAGGHLARRYRLPEPLIELRDALRRFAHASADVSDGLLADVGRVAQASGCGVTIDLDRFPLSQAASGWLACQPDEVSARLALAGGGDDYAVVCAIDPADEFAFIEAVRARSVPVEAIGAFAGEARLTVLAGGEEIAPKHLGWRH